MKDDLIIPLNGLKAGRTEFSWRCGKEFFDSFGNQDIMDAGLDVTAEVEKSGEYLGIDCRICGTVEVRCDRCMDELTLPVDTVAELSVKFGSEPAQEKVTVSGGRETVYLPEDGGDMDMSQTVYDYVCLSLPMRRIHEDGGCNSLALRYLSGDGTALDGRPEEEKKEKAHSPFAILEGLIDNKKEN